MPMASHIVHMPDKSLRVDDIDAMQIAQQAMASVDEKNQQLQAKDAELAEMRAKLKYYEDMNNATYSRPGTAGSSTSTGTFGLSSPAAVLSESFQLLPTPNEPAGTCCC